MGYIIRNGVIYGGGSADGDKIFHGTQAEWNALTTAEKAEYDFAAFTDDYDPSSITNPNLLDNPWFTVNQRGQSSYISSGGQIYTVDRWGMGSNNVSCDVANDIITLTHADNTNNGDLFQRVETYKFKDIVGKSITASIMLSDGSIYSQSGIMPTIESTNKIVVDFAIGNTGYKMSVVARTSNILVPIYCAVANATISIKAVKLELGSQSTLAMDTAPNYATELLKCQRYCVVLGGNYQLFGMGYSEGTSYIDMTYPLPVRMRTTPTLSMPDGVALCYGHTGAMSNYNYFTSITTVFDGGTTKGNNCAFRCVASDLVADQMYKIGTKDRKVILSADL